MSIEIILYTKKSTKSSLNKFLKEIGFKKSRHFIEEMNTDEMLHFMWFEFDNYISTTGVEATIFKASKNEQKKYNCSNWILHTRTRSSGSYQDKQKQNETIRGARRLFGGTFYNDWYGTNKYIDLSDYTMFTPLEKGISIISSNSLEKLEQITLCLKGYTNELSDIINNTQIDGLKELLLFKDPSRVLYNSLIPFLVAVLEYFFSQCFANYIKYDDRTRELIKYEKLRIDGSEALDVINRKSSIEQLITDSYNFQNIDSINKVYLKYDILDIKKTLSKRKKIDRKFYRVLPKIEELLEMRHRFVHELDIDYSLTKEVYLTYVGIVEKAIELTLLSLKDKGLKIERRY